MKKIKPDILCLQETKSEPEQLSKELLNYADYNSYFEFSKIKKGYSGVAIYSKQKPDEIIHGMGVKKFDDEGRIIGVYFKNFMNTRDLLLINVYFPQGGREGRLEYKLEFYDAFLKFIEKLRQKHKKVIFCGDINTAHEAIDLARPKENENNTGFLPEERAWLDEVIRHGYTDAFRYFYSNKKDIYTFWDQKTRARDRNVGWRIDSFFVTPEVLVKTKDSKILTDIYGSDHCPVTLEF